MKIRQSTEWLINLPREMKGKVTCSRFRRSLLPLPGPRPGLLVAGLIDKAVGSTTASSPTYVPQPGWSEINLRNLSGFLLKTAMGQLVLSLSSMKGGCWRVVVPLHLFKSLSVYSSLPYFSLEISCIDYQASFLRSNFGEQIWDQLI